MKRTTQGDFIFTAERKAAHPIDDIVMTMTDPVMVPLGRAFVYRFDEQEMASIPRNLLLK